MIRLLVRILLSALAFIAVLPMIGGIDFHGNFTAAIILAIVFAVCLWAVELIVTAVSAVLTVGTFGIALLWLIPLWILGFWLLPAMALLMVSEFLPGYLTVTDWGAAILGGFVMLFVSLITSKLFWKDKRV